VTLFAYGASFDVLWQPVARGVFDVSAAGQLGVSRSRREPTTVDEMALNDPS